MSTTPNKTPDAGVPTPQSGETRPMRCGHCFVTGGEQVWSIHCPRHGAMARTLGEGESVMAAIGRLGGLKGGRARAASLTAEQRSEIARKGGKARWKKS